MRRLYFATRLKFFLLRKELLLQLAYIFLIFVESVWAVSFLKGLRQTWVTLYNIDSKRLLYLQLQPRQGSMWETGEASTSQMYRNIISTEDRLIRSRQAPVKPVKPVFSYHLWTWNFQCSFNNRLSVSEVTNHFSSPTAIKLTDVFVAVKLLISRMPIKCLASDKKKGFWFRLHFTQQKLFPFWSHWLYKDEYTDTPKLID